MGDQLIPALNQQIVNLDSLKAQLDALCVRVDAMETSAERRMFERLRALVTK